jgi:hypothetical protein
MEVEAATAAAEAEAINAAGLRKNSRIDLPQQRFLRFILGSVGIHREFITAAARWIMEAKL